MWNFTMLQDVIIEFCTRVKKEQECDKSFTKTINDAK